MCAFLTMHSIPIMLVNTFSLSQLWLTWFCRAWMEEGPDVDVAICHSFGWKDLRERSSSTARFALRLTSLRAMWSNSLRVMQFVCLDGALQGSQLWQFCWCQGNPIPQRVFPLWANPWKTSSECWIWFRGCICLGGCIQWWCVVVVSNNFLTKKCNNKPVKQQSKMGWTW